MKKIITLILFLASINLFSQKQHFSLFHKKKQPDSERNVLGIDKKNKSQSYFSIAGGCILLGGVMQIITNLNNAPTSPLVPAYTNSNSPQYLNNYNEYLKNYKEWADTQKALQITSAALYTIGGLFIIVASKKIIDTKTASLKLNASPTSIGLCLNFK